MSLFLRSAAVSDQGVTRETNEDAAHAGPHLIAVADGIGGSPAGEVASEIAIKVLAALEAEGPRGSPLEHLRSAVAEANRRIREAVAGNPQLDGMGTTLTAILLTGRRLGLAHVGDSRAYLLRDGALVRLTKDDTYVQALVDRGAISAEEATTHPHRSVIIRAVQGEPISPVCTVMRPRRGDRHLLCSDGLSDVVDEAAIARALRDYPDQRACGERLVELALAAGGRDNITAVVADVSGHGFWPP